MVVSPDISAGCAFLNWGTLNDLIHFGTFSFHDTKKVEVLYSTHCADCALLSAKGQSRSGFGGNLPPPSRPNPVGCLNLILASAVPPPPSPVACLNLILASVIAPPPPVACFKWSLASVVTPPPLPPVACLNWMLASVVTSPPHPNPPSFAVSGWWAQCLVFRVRRKNWGPMCYRCARVESSRITSLQYYILYKFYSTKVWEWLIRLVARLCRSWPSSGIVTHISLRGKVPNLDTKVWTVWLLLPPFWLCADGRNCLNRDRVKYIVAQSQYCLVNQCNFVNEHLHLHCFICFHQLALTCFPNFQLHDKHYDWHGYKGKRLSVTVC